MKNPLFKLGVVAALGICGAGYSAWLNMPQPRVTVMAFTRGSIIESVQATGTLQPISTVRVDAHVPGRVRAIHADFNSIVRKGQVIAELDPSGLEAELARRMSSLRAAEAARERHQVTLDAARARLGRARSHGPQAMIGLSLLAIRRAEERLREADSHVSQARARVHAARANIAETTIKAPIDGVVISRNVNIGQTVSAISGAPALYVLGTDLARVQVAAQIGESDAGRITSGQQVPVQVDGFPGDTFAGTVSQIRPQPAAAPAGLSYSAVIEIDNPELKLKPGMKATVALEIARREDALRVPNAALAFHPTDQMFGALGQRVPENLYRRHDESRPGGQLPPVTRLRAAAIAARPARDANAESAAAPRRRAWLYVDERLEPVELQLGISDGTYTEVLNGYELPKDAKVVLQILTGREQPARPGAAEDPPLPAPRRGGRVPRAV
jgi:HlyD family secretion protein